MRPGYWPEFFPPGLVKTGLPTPGKAFILFVACLVLSVSSLRVLVFTGLFGRQVAGSADLVDIQAFGLEFGDLTATAGRDGYVEDARPDHAASGALVHGQGAPSTLPVPA